MSFPLSTIFEGDFNILSGSDTSLYGFGKLSVSDKVIIYSTENSTGVNSVGSLLVSGGVKINKNLHVHETLNVLYNSSFLTSTFIDTTNGLTNITGGNGLNVNVGSSINLISTSGNININASSNSVIISSGLNNPSSISLSNTHQDGGILLQSGNVNGSVNIISGSNGVNIFSSNGNILLTSTNSSSTYSVNSSSDNQNLNISLNGSTNSTLNIKSHGTSNAIDISSLNTAGSINISNNNGLSSGAINFLTGSNGFNVITNTNGSINLTSTNASSTYKVLSNGTNQNLLLHLQGDSNSSLHLKSDTNSTSAILIETTNTSASMLFKQNFSNGGIFFTSGSNGFNVLTQTSGSINLFSYGAPSNFINNALNNTDHLTLSINGTTSSKVIISNSSNSPEAIHLLASHSNGSILINSGNTVSIQSSSNSSGIEIGTLNNTPITIGRYDSTTVINGDLFIRGTTSMVNQQIVNIDDNIILLNSSPFDSSDGGYAVKRFQPANDSSLGEVVLDTSTYTGTVQLNGNTLTTICLDPSSSSTNDFYAGWWIKITSGTGANQVRKIKSYNGSTKIATIFDSSDQLSLSSYPIEGMDFTTIPDSSSTYSLYSCHYVMNIWDESSNQFAFICSNSNPSDKSNPTFTPNISHYTDLRINNLYSNTIFASSINNSTADTILYVTLNDMSSSPVNIPIYQNYGVFFVMVSPQTSTRTFASFFISRINDSSTSGVCNRIVSSKGLQNEMVNIQWPANSLPQLFYSPPPLSLSTTIYNIKIITV